MSAIAAFRSFTRFHLLVVLCYQNELLFSIQLIFAIYLNYKPRWRCTGNTTFESDVFSSDCEIYQACPVENLEFSAEFQSAAMDFGTVCAEKTLSTIVLSPLIYTGVLLGAMMGMSMDVFGRRTMALAVLPVGIVVLGISGFSPSKMLMTATRFVVLWVCGFMQVAVTTYCMELVRPEHRMPMRAFTNWGNARLALTTICYFSGGWKLAALISAICACPSLIFICIFPESPTWLYHQGRFKELHKSEARIACINGTGKLDICRVSPKVTAGPSDLWHDTTLRRRLIFLAAMWFAVGGQTYTNDLHSGSISDRFFLNQFLTSIVLLLSKWCLGLLDLFCPQLNRRNLQYFSQLATTICYTCLSILCVFSYEVLSSLDIGLQLKGGTLYMIVYLLGTLFIEFSWDVCYLTTIESMPTPVRASALSACSSVARVANIVAAFVKEMADIYEVLPFIVIASMGLINAIISFCFLCDTKGNDLNEVMAEDDETGDNQQDHQVNEKSQSIWYITDATLVENKK